MSLVEKWRHIAQLNLEVTSVLDNNNARGFGMALASAATDLESACTPRAPRPEWFGAPFDDEGKPTGKWDAWWFDGHGTLLSCHAGFSAVYGNNEWGESVTVPIDAVDRCIPVRRKGPPAMDVGWHVVGG